ncbi:ABA4-like family protein [Hamadaea sp. NPDC050747]|uniref:ABA4-like family protein n=1 Tax=Hamadaea sp. NPDC050747 TaxID=3155789 RepID=UPI0033CAE9DC
MTWFAIAFPLTVPFWALMILLPKWGRTSRIIASPLIVLPVLVAYFGAVAPILPDFAAEMLNPDLDGVRTLLSSDAGTSAVWAQVLAWDLFIGRWMYLDGRERNIPALIMSPLLILTILLSPFAVVIYLGLRTFYRKAAPETTGKAS